MGDGDINDIHRSDGLEAARAHHDSAKPFNAGEARDRAGSGERTPKLDDDAELERLARLSPLEYGRARKDAAKRLIGGSVTFLDVAVKAKRGALRLNKGDDLQGQELDFREPEPWPEPLDGAELLDDMTSAVKRYVVMAEHAARACALWIVHTYLLDCFQISPRLAIRSATHRCGKTTLLDIVSGLVLRALSSANVTAASVFRVIEACRPTLLIDEADTFLPEADELRGVLNSGHRKGGTAIRTVGDDHEPRKFSTYAACAIALIGKLPATLHDRSAPVIDLKRRLASEKVESFRLDRTAHLNELARKAARWAADNAEQIRDADPALPAGLFNRDGDNWRPLLAIAEAAGGKWPERAREAAAICCAVAGVEDASQLELLLSDIREVFAAKQADASTSADEIASAALVERLVAIEGHPWAEMGRSQSRLTPNRLARMLRPLGIGPEKVGPEDRRLQGYRRDRFKEAFSRYLLPEEGFKVDSRTAPTEVNDLGPFSKRTAQPILSTLKITETPGFPGECPDVHLRGVDGEKGGEGSASPLERGQPLSQRLPNRTASVAPSPASTSAPDPPAHRPYEVLLGGALGQPCGHCGLSYGFVRRIRRDGQIYALHQACADPFFAEAEGLAK
jgi:putative DNA primase/helicase